MVLKFWKWRDVIMINCMIFDIGGFFCLNKKC